MFWWPRPAFRAFQVPSSARAAQRELALRGVAHASLLVTGALRLIPHSGLVFRSRMTIWLTQCSSEWVHLRLQVATLRARFKQVSFLHGSPPLNARAGGFRTQLLTPCTLLRRSQTPCTFRKQPDPQVFCRGGERLGLARHLLASPRLLHGLRRVRAPGDPR